MLSISMHTQKEVVSGGILVPYQTRDEQQGGVTQLDSLE